MLIELKIHQGFWRPERDPRSPRPGWSELSLRPPGPGSPGSPPRGSVRCRPGSRCCPEPRNAPFVLTELIYLPPAPDKGAFPCLLQPTGTAIVQVKKNNLSYYIFELFLCFMTIFSLRLLFLPMFVHQRPSHLQIKKTLLYLPDQFIIIFSLLIIIKCRSSVKSRNLEDTLTIWNQNTTYCSLSVVFPNQFCNSKKHINLLSLFIRTSWKAMPKALPMSSYNNCLSVLVHSQDLLPHPTKK